MPGLIHAVAYAVVATGALVIIALCSWLSFVSLRAVLKWSGWWRDFFAFVVTRSRKDRRLLGRMR
ncbi:hypothetical protein [Myxococcus landrumensis]|uniref:Lipoprotein n=1 Tax=Myxococcus landrumensis TaxID=2813577 RepID=A0ABX7NFG1_9BACT|nr:hypothetical protein [Myxococcus landrumus]QSQ17211.1 hypothetical protein JY572_14615 [Myxococcus landrumus]